MGRLTAAVPRALHRGWGALGVWSGTRPPSLLLCPQVRSLEAHMYPEKLKVIAQQVQLQQQQEQVRLLHQEKLEREQQHLRTQVSRRHLRGALRLSGTSVPLGPRLPGCPVSCTHYCIESS